MTPNEARFKIDNTPSEDANGNRGIDAISDATLTVKLENNPSPAVAVTFWIYDPADSESPLASKSAPNIVWNENGSAHITPEHVTDEVTITLPTSSSANSYIIRCIAIVPMGSAVYERLIAIRTEVIVEQAVRKIVPYEAQQYSARSWYDAQNEMIDAMNLIAAGNLCVIDYLKYLDDMNMVIGPLAHEYAFASNSILFPFGGNPQRYSQDFTVREVVGGSAPGFYILISPSSTPPGGGAWGPASAPPSIGIADRLSVNDWVSLIYSTPEEGPEEELS